MNHPPDPDDVAELLKADRELTPEEQSRMRRVAEAGWKGLQSLLNGRSKTTYSVASERDFTECVFEHMSPEQRDAMMSSDLYSCPVCERQLKNRNTPVASSILLERARLRQLWLDVEQAPPEQMNEALDRFRRALGLAAW
jgi:hypothetical protein